MSTTPLTVLHLQCFVMVVETGSFAEAARRLGLSASAVSKAISRLEAGKGVRLLNRSTHSLSLTAEGEALIGPLREAIVAMDAADAAFGAVAREGTISRVRVGAPTAFLRACLAPLMPAFQAEHPDLVLDLRGSDEMADLAEAGLDIVLRTGALDGVPGHLRQTLMTFGWVACAAPSYLAQNGAPTHFDDLHDHCCIGFRNQRTGLVDPWRFRGTGNEPVRWVVEPAVVLDDANAVVAVARSGYGIAWAPEWLVAEHLRDGTLVSILSDYAAEPMMLSMVRRRNNRDPKRIERVLAFLKANVVTVSDRRHDAAAHQ